MNYHEFRTLMLCLRDGQLPVQRQIADQLSVSLGTVNSTVKALSERGLLDGKSITEEALRALEPYRVKRAVIFAAGFGTRMLPLTLSIPKCLVRVNGVPMITTVIDAFLRAGIKEIYVVRGYLGECLNQLLDKYPDLHFIDNPMFLEANSIYSAVCAKDLLANAYLSDADLIVKNPDLIHPYEYHTFFYGKPIDETSDWCFHANERHIIQGQSFGGKDCYLGVGLSHWTQEDGTRLGQAVARAYQTLGGQQLYWESVPLDLQPSDYTIYLRECSDEDIIELDSVKELKAVDSAYAI